MVSPEIPAAASSLLADLLSRPGLELTEVLRTRVSVHYETGLGSTPVVCVCTTDAVLLPNAIVTSRLPEPGGLTVGGGGLRGVDGTWRVCRWWRPRRPAGLRPPHDSRLPVPEDAGLVDVPTHDGELHPHELIGRGPGLTPAGDDLLAGALVTAHATGDPRHRAWRSDTVDALERRSTTIVSRGLLRHALDGYAVPELADVLEEVCAGADATEPVRRLLAVGHSSGAALLAGVRHTLTTRELEGAA